MFSALRRVAESQTLLVNEQSRLRAASGRNVFRMGFGQSPFLPPEHVIEALKLHAHRKEYSSVQGLEELREAIAGFHNRLSGMSVRAENILIAPGSKILLYTLMAAFEDADVLIPSPAWVSYEPQAKLLGHRVIRVETTFREGWRVTPERLSAALANRRGENVPAVLVLNYPGNPEGKTYSSQELEALSVALKGEPQLLVIADEIYALLHHAGTQASLAHYLPENTVVTTGLSKWCGAGGWRLGAALLPESMRGEFLHTLIGIGSEVYSCAPTPMQLAAIEAYQPEDPRITGYLSHQRRILAQLGQACHARLSEAGIQVHPPEGGFYLYVDFSPFAEKMRQRGIATSAQFCAALVEETGVALLPGSAFGLSESHLSARLSYVDFDGHAALTASQVTPPEMPLDEGFLRVHMHHMLEGIRRIGEWVNR